MLAPEMTEDYDVNAVIASQVARFVSAATGDWSNAHIGYGVLGFGYGIYDTARLAARDASVVAEASVAATIDETVGTDLSRAEVPGLWIGSRSDSSVDVDLSVAQSESLPRTMFVVYPDADEGFWNDDADGFDEKAATDTVDRLIAFFSRELPKRT
jgi:dienelactone hydrolase